MSGIPFERLRDFIARAFEKAGMKDGSLLISDDFAGAIYRVTYVGEAPRK